MPPSFHMFFNGNCFDPNISQRVHRYGLFWKLPFPNGFPGLGTAALAPERGSTTGILSKSLTLGDDDSGEMCQDRRGRFFQEKTAVLLVDIC